MFGKHVIKHSSSRSRPGSRKRKSSRHYFIKRLIIIIPLSSCSLFKKTTKTSAIESFDLSRQTEARSLDLKTSQKETQIYSYWKDSIFYQYEVIREEVDQAITGSLKVQENQAVKQETNIKESKPVEAWIYTGIILGIIGFVVIFKKLNG